MTDCHGAMLLFVSCRLLTRFIYLLVPIRRLSDFFILLRDVLTDALPIHL